MVGIWEMKITAGQRKTPYNCSYPKAAGQWLNQALCLIQSFYLINSEVLKNRHLWVAAKRYGQW
jgi:hypothetical protein